MRRLAVNLAVTPWYLVLETGSSLGLELSDNRPLSVGDPCFFLPSTEITSSPQWVPGTELRFSRLRGKQRYQPGRFSRGSVCFQSKVHPGIVSHAYNLSPWEAEIGVSLQVQG